jgi:hypothetical protein
VNNYIKICKHHGGLTNNEIKIWKWKNKTYKKCHKCLIEKSRRYEKQKRQDNDYVECKKKRDKERWIKKKQEITEIRKNPENLKRRRDWYQKNKEPVQKYCRDKQAQYRKYLADPYIKKIIQDGDKSIKIASIPKSIVDLKRNIVKLRRKINEKSDINLKKALDNVYKHDRRVTRTPPKKY